LQVRLHLRCDNLVNMDTFSKSDPFCVLLMQTGAGGGSWVELGRTEVMMHRCFDV